VKRVHPFVYGHVVAAMLTGIAAGLSLEAAQAAGIGMAMLGAGAIVSSTVCWWKPGFDAPWWQLLIVAWLANPLMLIALGFLIVDFGCLTGDRKGWECLGAAMSVLVVGACIPPPVGGLLWRWWQRRRAAA
jgi:hypothetical protein